MEKTFQKENYVMNSGQGWEFAHRFFMRIARFLWAKEHCEQIAHGRPLKWAIFSERAKKDRVKSKRTKSERAKSERAKEQISNPESQANS